MEIDLIIYKRKIVFIKKKKNNCVIFPVVLLISNNNIFIVFEFIKMKGSFKGNNNKKVN